MHVASAHVFDECIHVTRFGAITDGQFVFRRREPERANHHGSERVGEFALEHRAFAGHNTVIFASLAVEERRKDIGEKNLLCTFEIPFGAVEILRHHAEVDVFRAENVTDLTQHFVDAHVRACIARTVVASKK